MTLSPYREILSYAKKHHFTVPAFNSYNMESVQATVSAARKMDTPLIIQTYHAHMEYAGPEYIKAICDVAARDGKIAVALGLDHGKPFYGMTEEAAIMGGQLLLTGMTETAKPETVSIKAHAPKGLLITLYFDFDSAELTKESVGRLMLFVNEMENYQFNELHFDGYADEVGSDNYNYALSERRANAAANFLRENGVSSSFTVIGRGRLKLSQKEVDEEIGRFPWTEGGIDWTRVNRRARRVEIYNK